MRGLAGSIHMARRDGIVFIPAPFQPTAIINGYVFEPHYVCVKKGFACAPTRTAVKSNILFRRDPGRLPHASDFAAPPHGLIGIPEILHGMGI